MVVMRYVCWSIILICYMVSVWSDWCSPMAWGLVDVRTSVNVVMTRAVYQLSPSNGFFHDDVTKWKCFLCYWPFVRGIHRWPVEFHHKGCDAELWCFLWSAPNKQLSTQSRRRWFETPSRSLWLHCVNIMSHIPQNKATPWIGHLIWNK